MSFWESGLVLQGLWLSGLLLLAGLFRLVPLVARLGIPNSILAGLLGLILGPGVLDQIPLDYDALESLIYHSLGIVFIAVSLQTPEKGERSAGAVSIAFFVGVLLCLQALVGLGVCMAMGLHPGLGLLFPLGFEQGAPQALSVGRAWEEGNGLVDGGSLGLIMAALGMGWTIVVGIPIVLWGRRRGLVAEVDAAVQASLAQEAQAARREEPPGALDRLTEQVAAVGVVYLLTYWLISALVSWGPIASRPGIAAMGWGFSFIFGALIGLAARALLSRLPKGSPLDDGLLGRIAALTVDFSTCAALAGIQVVIFQANWVPIVLITTAGGLLTVLAILWLSPRAFPNAPFSHCLAIFGMATGTLPTALALVRVIDPELRTPAASSAVMGSALSVPLAAIYLLLLQQIAVLAWPERWPGGGWAAIGAITAFMLVQLLLWRLVGPLRLLRPLARIWPR